MFTLLPMRSCYRRSLARIPRSRLSTSISSRSPHARVFFLVFFYVNPKCCFYRSLKKADPKHAFLADLEEKSQLFDTAAAKFSAKVA